MTRSCGVRKDTATRRRSSVPPCSLFLSLSLSLSLFLRITPTCKLPYPCFPTHDDADVSLSRATHARNVHNPSSSSSSSSSSPSPNIRFYPPPPPTTHPRQEFARITRQHSANFLLRQHNAFPFRPCLLSRVQSCLVALARVVFPARVAPHPRWTFL